MNEILFIYVSPEAYNLFKVNGRKALEGDNIVSFTYKYSKDQSNNDFGRDMIYMSKYSQKNKIDIVENLWYKDLKKLIQDQSIQYNETKQFDAKNQAALKLFALLFPNYFKYKDSYQPKNRRVPENIENIAIFISKNEWKNLKSSGKLPTPLKRIT